MLDFTKIRTGKQTDPPRILLYGVIGIGKTYFANEAEACILSTEDGRRAMTIKGCWLPVSKSLEEVHNWIDCFLDPEGRKTIMEAAGRTEPFGAFCIDTVDWLERLIHESILADDKYDNMAEARGGYGKAYKAACRKMHMILQKLDQVRDQGFPVILLAHCSIDTFKNPEGEPYDFYRPTMHKDTAARVADWADMVLFAKYRVVTQSTGQGKKVVAKGSGERVMYTEERPTFWAKGGAAYGMEPEMPFCWHELMKAVG